MGINAKPHLDLCFLRPSLPCISALSVHVFLCFPTFQVCTTCEEVLEQFWEEEEEEWHFKEAVRSPGGQVGVTE